MVSSISRGKLQVGPTTKGSPYWSISTWWTIAWINIFSWRVRGTAGRRQKQQEKTSISIWKPRWWTRVLGVSYGSSTRMGPRMAHDLLKDARQGDMDFKLFQINLVGLLWKLDSVIGLELFYCNRLGLDTCSYPLSYIKRGTTHPLVTPTIIQSIQCKKATRRLDIKAITRQQGPNQYKPFVSLRLVSSSAYVEALRTSSRVTPWWVAGHQTPTKGFWNVFRWSWGKQQGW